MDSILDRAIEETIHSKMLETHVMLPATVVSFNSKEQTVDVQITLKRNYNGKPEALNVLKDVPIIYPRAGGYLLTFPIKPGDGCKLDFCDRSIDEWLTEGGIVDPKDSRNHSLSDAVAYVGMWDNTKKISEYNPEQPELRTEDGVKKVWLSDDGWVEMVNTQLDTRVVLKDNGDVRLANDKVNTSVEVFEDTKIKMSNPLAKTRIAPNGEILMRNPLISRTMEEFGDIKDKTLLGKQYIRKSGERYFKNMLAKEIFKSSGKVEIRTLLNKFDMLPGGVTNIGNALNKLKINPALASLGSAAASIKAIPTVGKIILKDASGIVTGSILNKLIDVVGQITSNLGLDIMSLITDEIEAVEQIVNNLPQDVDDVFETVRQSITDLLIENSVDLTSESAFLILNLSDNLDQQWDDVVFDNLLNKLNEVLYG